jgi:antitoxin component of MazEF toxin-antitoxin module
MSCPVEEHWEAVKRILRYVQGTKNNKLVLGGVVGEAIMVGYTDADWGGNDNNRRSISGYCFLLGEGVVSWSSKKQTSVALSSTEAEYMALTQATKEAMCLKHFLGELNLHKGEALTIKVDNQSCIALAKNPEFHARTKHIDIQCHFIREKVEEGEVTLEYCPTRLMVADILTKPLPRDKHEWCTNGMGIHPYI